MPADRMPADRMPAVRIPSPRRATTLSNVPEPAPGAGSLTQRNARSGRLCDACGDERLTEIAMTLTDGTVALFSSCHHCERKSWRASDTGTVIDLSFDAVIDRTRKIR